MCCIRWGSRNFDLFWWVLKSTLLFCFAENIVELLFPGAKSFAAGYQCWGIKSSAIRPKNWVGQIFGPIFSRLWTKVHQIKFTCAGVSVVCNTIFRLKLPCYVSEIFAIKSWSCLKLCCNVMFLDSHISGGRGPKFLTEFDKFGSPSNVAKFGDDRRNNLGD